MRRTVIGIPATGRRRIRRDCGIVIGALVAQGGPGLLILSSRRFQVLVGNVDLLLQRVELGILKQFPPISAQVVVIGLGSLPVSHLLVCGWGWGRRSFVFRSNGATGKLKDRSEKESRGRDWPPGLRINGPLLRRHHFVSPGSVAFTI